MNDAALIVLLLVLLVWAVFSAWFSAHNLTGPMLFMAAGLVLANSDWGIGRVDVESSAIHTLAELTLALLLFSDASGVPPASARQDLPLTARLLAIGLPLSILAGTGIAILLFPSLPLAIAGLIAASLAPTDAALSASVISDDRLPIRVRRVLNVESGLNDGIATPVVTYCIAAAATVMGVAGTEHEDGISALGQLAIGGGVGAAVALIGGHVMSCTRRRGWMQEGSRRLAALALALLSFVVASEAGGNPFVSAFIAGIVFGATARDDAVESIELAELAGSLMSLVLWFIFGASFVLPAFEHLDASVVIYAIASLTLVRMAPVALALVGSRQAWTTVSFIGWFGPRGLASVVFALLAVEELGNTDPNVLIAVRTITVTIVLSVAAHGITARPLATRYVNSTRRAAPTT